MSKTFFESGNQSLNSGNIALTRFCGPAFLPSGEILTGPHCLQISITEAGRSAWTSLTRKEVAALISQLARFLDGVSDSDEVHSFESMFALPDGYDDERIKGILDHYENQTDEEAVLEDEGQ